MVSVNLHLAPLLNVEGDAIGSMLVLEDITREKRVRGTMSRYMAKEVVDKLLESGEEVLEGTDQEATILFSDIRGFAGISESLGTRKTVKLLNEYFSEMVDVIFSHEGILDKYIGDAIMAVFGAPVSNPYDADHSITVANEMMRSLRTFNARRSDDGEKPIEIGIGISTGRVLAGSIGSRKRMEYTVIGDSVNLAARLESANKYYGTKILLGADTVERLASPKNLREIDLLRAKGFVKPVAIYEMMEHYPEAVQKRLLEVVPIYEEGLSAYRRQRWEQAIRLFGSALAQHPEDGPSQVLLNRCIYYKDNPPPESWDGVWTMKEK
jgi:adenylate cyclase